MIQYEHGRISLWMLILLCVCLAFPVFAVVDDVVYPDGDTSVGESVTHGDGDPYNGSCGPLCTTQNCAILIDEVSPPDDNMVAHVESSEQIMVFNMETPDCTPSTAPNAQQVVVNVSECDYIDCDKSSGNGEPQVGVHLYCDDSGTPTEQEQWVLWAADLGGDEIDEVHSGNWTFDPGGDHPNCETDGSDVQFAVYMDLDGKAAAQRTTCYDSIYWNVDCTTTEGRRVITVGALDELDGPSRELAEDVLALWNSDGHATEKKVDRNNN